MPEVLFEEIECKSALNRVHATGMPFRWSLNPYRGCQHACVYCFARGTHEFLGYDAGRSFEQRVVVKMNAAAALRQDLARPSWRRELVAVGTACDPYQQAEMKYGITRGCLRAFIDRASPISIVTKSPNVLRDLDLLQELTRHASVTVNFSISTLDEEVWKHVEPETSKPYKRLEAMQRLTEAGVHAGVLLAPILPGLTDGRENLEAVVRAAADHGASFMGNNVLYLKPGTKEWFMPFLRETYPHLAERYARYYRGAYAPADYTREVMSVVRDLKRTYGLDGERYTPAEPRGQLQMSLS